MCMLSPSSAEMKSPGDSEAEESDAESISEGEEEGEGEGDHGIELLVSGKSLVEVNSLVSLLALTISWTEF